MGNTIMKSNARKVRRLYNDRVLAGFAGGTADAFTLFERFEAKHGRKADVSYGLRGYSAVQAWAIAANKAGSLEGSKVAAVLDTFDEEPLVIGPTTYTSVAVWTCQNAILTVLLSLPKKGRRGRSDQEGQGYEAHGSCRR